MPSSGSPVGRRTLIARLFAVAAGGTTTALLTACGQSSSPTTPPQVPTTAPKQAAPAVAPTAPAAGKPAASAPRRGGQIVAAQEADPITLDPWRTNNISAVQAFEHVYESLTQFDENLNVMPCLAEAWETPDDRTYVFNLRRGVKFHSGEEMTAEDVVYSFERALDERTAAPMRALLSPIASMEIRDRHTLVANLKGPTPMLLGNMATLRVSAIVPKGFEERVNAKAQAIGTGPFRLVEYVPNDYLRYERHADYWDSGRPQLDGMILKIMPDQNARLAALSAGQVQHAGIDTQGAEQVARLPGVKVLRSPSDWLQGHLFNASRTPFDDKRVRQALRLAVDVQDVIAKGVFGAAVPSGPIPPGFGDWALSESELRFLKPDLQKARQLLAEAGYPNGFQTTILLSPQYPEYVATSLVCQEAWRKIGVEVTLEQLEWGTYLGRIQRSGGFDYDIRPATTVARADPDGILYDFFRSGVVLNPGYSNPELDALLDEARQTLDRERRKQLYFQSQRILDEDSPLMWWYAKQNIEAVSDRLAGYRQSVTSRRTFFKDAYLA